MKLPRISVQTIMAVVVVVAANCMVIRAVSTRPGAMTGNINLVLLNGMPMANLLAITVGLWVRGRKTLGSFWPGFTILGLVGLVVSIARLEPILDWWETALTRLGLIAWVGQSEVRILVAQVVILPLLLLIPQLVLASIGGGLTRRIGRRPIAPAEVAPSRVRLASLLAMASLLVIPAVGIEVYLARTVDRKVERLAVNTEAVIVVKQLPNMQRVSPGSKLAVFSEDRIPRVAIGTRVKVNRDDKPSVIQGMQLGPKGETFIGDFRMVDVTMLDGKSAGKPGWLPRYAIQSSRWSPVAR